MSLSAQRVAMQRNTRQALRAWGAGRAAAGTQAQEVLAGEVMAADFASRLFGVGKYPMAARRAEGHSLWLANIMLGACSEHFVPLFPLVPHCPPLSPVAPRWPPLSPVVPRSPALLTPFLSRFSSSHPPEFHLQHAAPASSLKSLATCAALAALALAAPAALAQEKTLRIAMTAADIPRTLGQPDQGFEGNRFTGIPIYDSLTQWDLSQADAPSVLIPGLATSWAVDAKDKTRWVFTLRPGVKFHDGSAFDADAVVWNVQKVLDKNAPQFDASQVGVTTSRIPTLRSARKIDDLKVELGTSEPDAFLPINLTNLFMASPAQWRKKFDAAAGATPADKGKAAWTAFAAAPAGTGPFKVTRFVARERLELAASKTYWDARRVPKIGKVVLLPMPEANARTAARLGGQVDWIEAPAPDASAQITQRGFKIYANAQPHVWPWQLSFIAGSPWLDKRVRQAANLCIDRSGMKQLLGGMMAEPKGTVSPGHPWFGKPGFDIRYDPKAGQALMAQAGHSAAKPLKVKV